LLGGVLIGALVIGFGFKMATPIVKKVCQSILENPDKTAREARVVSVEAVVLKPGTISRRITTVGKLHANESVTLRAEMPGRIKEIAFKEGTMVKKGDVLIRFEDEEFQAELEKAEADVEYRQVRFGRFESLQTKGLGRGTEYDQERGLLNIAKAQVDVAKAKLAKATIHAPFDGKIGLMQDVSVGAIVDGQKELVTLVDFDPMKIDFKVAEKFIHDIGVGQTAKVNIDSIPDQDFQATVEAIDSRVDPQTHSIAVRAVIPNEDGKLQAGLFASIGVIVGVKNDALILPEAALGREGDIEYVWVVTNGKTGRKRVLTGTKENGQVEIIAGLRAGEIIVTSGQLKLGEGTAVKISNMGDGDVDVSDDDGDDENSENIEAKLEGTSQKEETPKDAPSEVPPSPIDPAKAPKDDPSGPIKTDPSPEAEKASLPGDAGMNAEENSDKDGEVAKVVSLEKPSGKDKATEAKTGQERAPTDPKKSFFAKARDFIVHKFRGNQEK
jgi:membrane fusion protein (multidrug efflux system)